MGNLSHLHLIDTATDSVRADLKAMHRRIGFPLAMAALAAASPNLACGDAIWLFHD
jgi:hypothetical protein